MCEIEADGCWFEAHIPLDVESQPINSHRSKLSQHFEESAAPHVENCQAFEDGEEEMEVQDEEDEEASTVPPAHMSTALTFLSGHKRNLSPEGRQKNVT